MLKRIIAAVSALLLAGVGVLFVIRYASQADARALEGQETVDVVVAAGPIEEGLTADQLTQLVEVREVPQAYVAEGAVAELADLDNKILTVDLAAGEQLQVHRFATEDELRAQGEFTLPDEAENLHQVTIPLENARALGGNIAPGDTVGVFVSVEASGDSGYVMGSDGRITREPQPADGDSEGGSDNGRESEGDGGGGDIPMTHLQLHKVLVVRVDGGKVVPPAGGDGEGEASEPAQGAPTNDAVHVTLALPAEQAEQLVFGMEFGTVWLSLEPEGAAEDKTEVVVVTVPTEARSLYEDTRE